MTEIYSLIGANINAVTVSPRGNFIVTGGKDKKKVRVFDFSDVEKPAPQHDAGAPVNCLAFNHRCQGLQLELTLDGKSGTSRPRTLQSLLMEASSY